MIPDYKHALIIGAGAGLSASLARKFAAEGLRVSLAARDARKLESLAAQTGASTHTCDAGQAAEITRLFATLDVDGAPDVVVYNPSARVRGGIASLDPEAVRKAVEITALGAFYAAREATIRMEKQGHGSILFTGASAGVKGFANSTVFAMGKFALRGLAQALARELHGKGIHIGHFVIDGAIRNEAGGHHRAGPEQVEDSHLSPDAIAESYWHFLRQDRSAWAWEIELRPWVETF